MAGRLTICVCLTCFFALVVYSRCWAVAPESSSYNRQQQRAYTASQSKRFTPCRLSLPPTSVSNKPGGSQWRLTLAEARRISLSHNKDIAYAKYKPMENAAIIDSEDSVFDTVLEFGGVWSMVDRQVANEVQSLGSKFSATTNDKFDPWMELPDTLALSKRLRTGGNMRVSQGAVYDKVRPVGDFVLVNPYWLSSTNFTLEHSLLRGCGLKINKVGICIAMANQKQSVHEFRSTVQSQLLAVELAYWTLYYARRDLASRRAAVIQGRATWKKEQEKLELGNGCIPDVAQAREYYDKFRIESNTAERNVLVEETNLRRILGIASHDGSRIFIGDQPYLAEPVIDWQADLDRAIRNRPELNSQREALRAAQLELYREKNGLLPDVSFIGSYSMTGLADQYGKSIKDLTGGKYNEWTLGFVYRQPIGRRPAISSTRRAEAFLAGQRAMLRKEEHNIGCELQAAYQELVLSWQALALYKSRLKAATVQVDSRRILYEIGEMTVDLYLRAQVTYSDSQRDQAMGIARYNEAIANWEFTKGAIMQRGFVVMPEEIPLPAGIPNNNQSEKGKEQSRNPAVVPLPPVTDAVISQ